MSVITALTSQNTKGVNGIHLIPTQFVHDQIIDVMIDIPPSCFKTGKLSSIRTHFLGMLASKETIDCVADILKEYNVPCVVDPVCSRLTILTEGNGVNIWLNPSSSRSDKCIYRPFIAALLDSDTKYTGGPSPGKTFWKRFRESGRLIIGEAG